MVRNPLPDIRRDQMQAAEDMGMMLEFVEPEI
jgi:hypothetical protein